MWPRRSLQQLSFSFLLQLLVVACASGGHATPPGVVPAQQQTKAPTCDSILPGSLSGPQANVGPYSACMAPAKCVAGNASAAVDIGGTYCTHHYDSRCDPGDCALPQDCKAVYSLSSTGVSVFACTAVADPMCTVAGERKCTCSLTIAAAGTLVCRCACRNP